MSRTGKRRRQAQPAEYPPNMRCRNKLGCGHWSPVSDKPIDTPTTHCAKCDSKVSVGALRVLSDNAKMPTETRKAKDQRARSDAAMLATDWKPRDKRRFPI